MDPVYKRCHINNHHVLKEALPLSRGIEHCENIIINLKDSKTKNIIEPVKIRIRYQLEEEVLLEKLGNNRTREEFQTHPILVKADRIHGRDGFCQTCPIAKESPDITISIPFEVGCGLDEICLADLEITGELPQLREESEQPTFVIGSNKTLKFNVHITNKGESAYLTRVYIELGSPAKIARIPPECHEISHLPFMETTSDTKGDSATLNGTVSQQNDKSHGNHSDDKVLGETGTDNKMNISSIYTRCDLDNPLPTNSTREQVVEIDMKNVYHSQGMHIFAYVTTVSNESTPENNYWARYIPFIYNADMEIIGSAGKNDLFTYFKENQNESESRIKFYHIYQVKKYGYSPVEKINIIFKIPRFIDQVNFLRILATEGSQSGQSFPCSVLDEGDTEQNQADDDLNSVNTDYNSREMTLKLNHSSTQVPSNRTLYLNCSSLTKKDEHSVGCMSVSCAAGPFVNSLTVAKVLLEMELDVGSLEKLMGLRDIILLETQGIVEVVEPTGLIQPTIDKPDISWASTYFIGDIPKKHVESWVLALAIAGGFMLLLFVAMAMHKAGFFERKKKEELKSLKRKTLAEYTTNDNGEQEQEIEQASIE
ncbi:integrin alpha-PS3-like isoform X2 [Hetaerina americana]